MPNESGDLKLLANFRKLIDLVSADTDYNLQTRRSSRRRSKPSTPQAWPQRMTCRHSLRRT